MDKWWDDFVASRYQSKMAPYLAGGGAEALDYLQREAYQHKLKEMEYVFSFLRADNWNPYINGVLYANRRRALRKMGWKKIFELHDVFEKSDDFEKIYKDVCNFSQILMSYDFLRNVGNSESLEVTKKLKKKYEPRFEKVGEKVQKLSDQEYINYISRFADIYDRFPHPHKSYYLIGLSVIEPQLLVGLHKKYGTEILTDAIIDWGKQYQYAAQQKREKNNLLYRELRSALTVAVCVAGNRAGASRYVTSCLVGLSGLLALHALIKYHKEQKKIEKSKEEQKIFTESPEIIAVQNNIKKSLLAEKV